MFVYFLIVLHFEKKDFKAENNDSFRCLKSDGQYLSVRYGT